MRKDTKKANCWRAVAGVCSTTLTDILGSSHRPVPAHIGHGSLPGQPSPPPSLCTQVSHSLTEVSRAGLGQWFRPGTSMSYPSLDERAQPGRTPRPIYSHSVGSIAVDSPHIKNSLCVLLNLYSLCLHSLQYSRKDFLHCVQDYKHLERFTPQESPLCYTAF